ncbi:MAG: hypothetical protein P8L85_22235 [Rubripirellula sp.]|nr:hypothetical protein [Rubripirellula sp.]
MGGITSSGDSRVDIHQLLNEFYPPPKGHSQLGEFDSVESVPSPSDRLLDHHGHMTVAVESHFGQNVDVHVHRCKRQGDWYSREITLITQQSQRTIQYGIVRLDTTKLDAEVWRKIESQQVPLGRALIEHDVLREVQMCELWKVTAGPCLAEMMHLQLNDELYGRTALIYCDGVPAIELLEIVVPD